MESANGSAGSKADEIINQRITYHHNSEKDHEIRGRGSVSD